MLEFIKQLIGNAVQPSVDLGDGLILARGADGEMSVVDVLKHKGVNRYRDEVATFTGVKDFITWARSHQQPGSTFFVNPINNAGTVNVGKFVVDYGEQETLATARREHIAHLVLQLHPLYVMAQKLMNWQDQAAFATNVRICANLFTKPLSSEMLMIAQQLKITSQCDYQSGHDDASGSVNMVFRQINKATAASSDRELVIPEVVDLWVPRYLGADKSFIRLRFEWRAPESNGQKIQMRLVYDNEVVDSFEELQGVIEQLSDAGLHCLWGKTE